MQGEPRRYRFAYTKLGPSAFLSHLDLIRALPRAFRRLELPLYYSSGYHPKPEMTFGPALSLGVASLEELVDVKITADIDPAAIAAELGDGAPDGIRFTGGVAPRPAGRGASRASSTARATSSRSRGARSPTREESVARGERRRFLASTEHKVLRRIDGIGKWVDVRSFVRGIALGHATRRRGAAPGARRARRAIW